MSKEKYSANSISFLWCPSPYPVMWVDRPEEVPEWDTSRGCPLGVYAKHVQQWELRDAPNSGYPRLVRRSLDQLVAPRNRVENDVVNELMYLSRYLKPAREGKQLNNLKNAVLKLADKYGAPSRHDENTLHEWLVLVYYVKTYVWALQEMNDDSKPLQQTFLDRHTLIYLRTRAKREGRTDIELDDCDCAFRDRETITVKTAEDFKKIAVLLNSVNERIKSPDFRSERRDEPDKDDPVWGELIALKELLRYADKTEDDVLETKRPLTAFRHNVAQGLYNHFGTTVSAYRDSEGLSLFFIPTAEQGILLQVPLNVWIRFKLSELWRHGAEVKPCPVCGTLFAPSHGNAKYCKPNGPCANKAFRQRQDARLSTTA